jgi:glycolate oxidase FAD binding subunit
MTTFNPATAAELTDAVAWAVSEETPLEIIGRGTKRGIGNAVETGHGIDLSGLTGVTLYEPEELVLSARAGTPLAEIEALVASKGQELAFEPMDYGPLLGGEAGRSTIGGVLAANLSGPRRIKAGAARDHILGVSAVSGRGEAFKSGGRVVKNVTGYDLSKLMAGSWGTLAVVSDLTFKVLPAAETEITLAVRGLLDEAAVGFMAAAMGSSAEVSAAAHLPYGVAGRLPGALGNDAATLLRVEGFGPSVAYRIESLKSLLQAAGDLHEIPHETSRALWRDIRDCRPFADGGETPVWRISMAPTHGHHMVMALRMRVAVEAFYDWAGGLVWLAMPDGEPEAELVRELVGKLGGHATLVRASPALRSGMSVFQPQPAPLAALSARLKQEFDPKNILNPGRMA